MERKIRILLAKPGLDGHDRGIKVLKLMGEADLDDVLLTGGGIIPDKDMEALQKQGVGCLFGPGNQMTEIIEYITSWVDENCPSRKEETA